MSGRLVTQVLEDPEPRNPTARLVLTAIAERIRADQVDTGRYVSFAELAALTGLNRGTVIRQVDALERTGHLAVRRRPRQASIYRIRSRTERLALVAQRDHPERGGVADRDQPSRRAQPPLVAQRDRGSRTARPNTGTPVTPGEAGDVPLLDEEEAVTARDAGPTVKPRSAPTREQLEEERATWFAAAALGSAAAAARVATIDAQLEALADG